MHFAETQVLVDLDGAECYGGENIVHITNGTRMDFPFKSVKREPMLQEMTRAELVDKQRLRERQIRDERQRQAIAAGLWIASDRMEANRIPGFKWPPGGVNWPEIQAAYTDYAFWKHNLCELETEKQMRDAMALGSFFFVLLGAPVGIRFAKRDFLSAFITCFVPIILAYYPLTMLGMNLGKDGNVTPYVVYAGNVVLLALALLWALPPVLKH